MENIQIFNNPEFGEIRTIIIDGEPWFVGRDVAAKLGYLKPENAISKWCDSEDTLKWGIPSNGGEQKTLIINESGLYSLIFGSKLESAKRFKHWVTSEVLPSIHRTGNYGIPKDTDGKIALLAQGHNELRADINNVRTEVETLKNELPILPLEADRIIAAVKAKGVSVMGGKESAAYHNRSLVNSVYKDIYREVYRNFGVTTYKAIRRNQCDKVLEVVGKYELPVILRERVGMANAQQTLNLEGGAC